MTRHTLPPIADFPTATGSSPSQSAATTLPGSHSNDGHTTHGAHNDTLSARSGRLSHRFQNSARGVAALLSSRKKRAGRLHSNAPIEELRTVHEWKLLPSVRNRLIEAYHNHHSDLRDFWGVYTLLQDCSINASPPFLRSALEHLGVIAAVASSSVDAPSVTSPPAAIRPVGGAPNAEQFFLDEHCFLLLVEEIMCNDQHKAVYFEDDSQLIELALTMERGPNDGSPQQSPERVSTTPSANVSGCNTPKCSVVVTAGELESVLNRFNMNDTASEAHKGGIPLNHRGHDLLSELQEQLREPTEDVASHRRQSLAHNGSFVSSEESIVPVVSATVRPPSSECAVPLDFFCSTLNRQRIQTPDPLVDFRSPPRKRSISVVGAATNQTTLSVDTTPGMRSKHHSMLPPLLRSGTHRVDEASLLHAMSAMKASLGQSFATIKSGESHQQMDKHTKAQSMGKPQSQLLPPIASPSLRAAENREGAVVSILKVSDDPFHCAGRSEVSGIFDDGSSLSLGGNQLDFSAATAPSAATNITASRDPRAYRKPWSEAHRRSKKLQPVDVAMSPREKLQSECHRMDAATLRAAYEQLSDSDRRALSAGTRRLLRIALEMNGSSLSTQRQHNNGGATVRNDETSVKLSSGQSDNTMLERWTRGGDVVQGRTCRKKIEKRK